MFKYLFMGLAAVNLASVQAFHEMNDDQTDYTYPHPHGIKAGHCPHKPGEIVSKVKDTLDLKKLYGIWKVYYDEKFLNHNFTCMGTKFIPLQDLEHVQDEELLKKE